MKRALTIATILSVSALGLSACDVFVTAEQNGDKGKLGQPCDNGACQGEFVVCNQQQDECVCQYTACIDFCCPDGQHCEGDKCVDGCQPECSGKECGPDGCGGDCPPNNCTGGKICNPTTGQCIVCSPDCSGKSCGDDDGCGTKCLVQSCGTGHFCTDDDPHCAACDNDQHCGGDCAACTGSDHCQGGSCCHDECPQTGNKRCDPQVADAFETCGNYDADACLEWGDSTDCPSGESCSNGVCSSQCSDECTTPPVNFCDGNQHFECADVDGDPCLDRHLVETCANFCDPTTVACVECLGQNDCNDDDSCTNDSCDAGNCQHPYSGDGAACELEVDSVMYSGSCQDGECFCNLDDACGASCHDCSQDAFDNVCIHGNVSAIHCGCLIDGDCSGTPSMYCNAASDAHCEYCNTNTHCGIGCDNCQDDPHDKICINGVRCGCNDNLNCAANQFCSSIGCARNTWDTPDTGQTLCYNATGLLYPCPVPSGNDFFGQDSNYNRPRNFSQFGVDPQFVIEEGVTSLDWTKPFWGDKTWIEARDFCQTLYWNNTGDWRLPTAGELLTIVDRGKHDPAIDQTLFDLDPFWPVFWSSSPASGDRRTVDFTIGTLSQADDSSTKAAVRCVRGPVWGRTPDPGQRFVNIGFYHDNVTGINWQRMIDAAPYTWQDALAHCASAGYRLPDLNEMLSLYDYDSDPVAQYSPTDLGLRWTSTTVASNTSKAWVIDYSTGALLPSASKTDDANYALICIEPY